MSIGAARETSVNLRKPICRERLLIPALGVKIMRIMEKNTSVTINTMEDKEIKQVLTI